VKVPAYPAIGGTGRVPVRMTSDRRFPLLLFEYVIRIGEWVKLIQKEEAGGLEFHLGH